MKIPALVLTVLLVMSLVACGGSGGNVPSGGGSSEVSSEAGSGVSSSEESGEAQPESESETSSEASSVSPGGASSSTAAGPASQGNESVSSQAQSRDTQVEDMKTNIVVFGDFRLVPNREGSTERQKRLYQRYKEVGEKYNCTFQNKTTLPCQVLVQFDYNIMRKDPTVDIFCLRMDQDMAFKSEQYLYDLSKVLDVKAENFNRDIIEMYTDRKTGSVYAFAGYEFGPQSFIVFNKSIFDRCGVEYPYQYVKNNTWSYDKFLDLAQRITNNAGGVKGFYGIANDPAVSSFLFGFGGSLYYIDSGGKYRSGLSKPETVQGLQFIRDLNAKHKVTKLPEIGVPEAAINNFEAGSVAMAYITADQLPLLQNMGDDYGIVPCPKMPGVKDWPNSMESCYVMVMPRNIDPERAKLVGKVFSEILKPLGTPEEQKRWIEEEYKNRCRDNESVEMLKLIGATGPRITNASVVAPRVYYSLMYNDLARALRGDNDLAVTLQEYDYIMQDDLNRINSGK